MTTYLNDTFTGTVNTALPSHTADDGHTWSTSGTANANQLSGDGFLYNAAPPGIYLSNATPNASGDYQVDFSFKVKSLLASDIVIFHSRLVDTNNFYYASITQAGLLQLQKSIANVATTLGSVNVSLVAGTTHTISLVLSGSTLKVLWDGLLAFQATDSAYAAAGKVGVRIGGGTTTTQTASTGLQADSIVARDIPTAVTAPTIGTVSISTSGGVDTVSYPAPVAGTNAVSGVALYVGSTTNGQNLTPVATNSGTGSGSFTNPQATIGTNYYVVRAYDNATPRNHSAVSNEVSSAAPGTTIAANDTNLLYSPANWDVTSVRAKTINAGAEVRALINTGAATAFSLLFDASGNVAPLPQVSVLIDDVVVYEGAVAASVSVTIPTTPANQWTKHAIQVIAKSVSNSVNLWAGIQGSINLTGIFVNATGAVTQAIPVHPLNVVCIGDSITAGAGTLNRNASNDVDQNSARVAWSYLLTKNLGAEVGVVGFPATGLTVAASSTTGQVPATPSTYNVLYSGGPARSFATTDVVVINLGSNDGSTNTTSALTTVLNGILSTLKSTGIIVVLRPFNDSVATAQGSYLQAAIAACSAPTRVSYIDTTGFLPLADTDTSNASLHPRGYANVAYLSSLVANSIRTVLNQGKIFLNKSGTAVSINPKKA